MPLSEQEQEELKTLQEERKTQHMSDSNRVRLSELQKKEEEGKESKETNTKDKKTVTAAPAGGK